MPRDDTEILIVGAGPTGLVLALWLHRLGVRARLIDKAPAPGMASRALGIQARTLEFYRQLGIADAVVARGLEFTAANFWARGRHAARAAFGAMGKGISPYPYMLILPQDAHERLLIEALAGLGVQVERGSELLEVEQGAGRIVARLRRADGTEERCETLYLAGCDGAHSRVRAAIGANFPGGTYAHRFYVADVVAHGPVTNGELHVALDDEDFLGVFPMQGEGHVRLVGTVKQQADDAPAPQWADVQGTVLRRLGIEVAQVNWFSTYHVHHRVAAPWRQGGTFLLGDAAHLHSPVGAQGMNTGIADATNLGWKLAAVLQGHAAPALLESFEAERIPFARRLVATTDRMFTLATSPGLVARILRTQLLPRAMALATASPTVRRFMFRTLSQTALHYRASPVSEGKAGGIHAGDRMPWVPFGGADNFAPLAALDWQLHLHGTAPAALAEAASTRGLALHAFPWSPAAAAAGLAKDALYLVRPDGYVGLADQTADPARLGAYLDRLGIRPRNATGTTFDSPA